MGKMSDRSQTMRTPGGKGVAYGAFASAFGLGLIHFVVNLVGYIHSPAEQQNVGLFVLWGGLPSLICFIFAAAALALARPWGGNRWLQPARAIAWAGSASMGLLSVWNLVLAVQREDFTIFVRVLGPGPWSLLGASLFGLAALAAGRRLTSARQLTLN